MICRWFYINDRCGIESLGPLPLEKAKAYQEEHPGRVIFTVNGLDMLRDNINQVLRESQNKRQIQ